ncbi:MAG: glutamate synthase subunit beta [Helicobacteraceae bacterium]|jgi:glutamate synthase (NADPH/NADH) small chain|nr:glutamate synthase subunit beta [Helicobacteraceae bacterium]
MQNFTKIERLTPKKAQALDRLKSFGEIYSLFDGGKAASQAERCVQCGNPYCSVCGCPLHNYIPYWLKAIAENNRVGAFRLSSENSPFPEILGRICPQDRLCESACTLGADNFGAISIGAIETAINENAFELGESIAYPAVTSGKKVAVIGSGPASLSAATFLARAKIAVEIFEKDERAGGLLTFGIPNFKLDKRVVDRRFEWLKKAGVKIRLGAEVGKEVDFKDLTDRFDAVFVGVGARRSAAAKIANEDARGVLPAIDFLNATQKNLFGGAKDPRFDVKNKKVVVIGGGDTAMDCVRTALRLGASSVVCVYRRGESDMPGAKKEFINAKEEGAEFIFNRAPNRIEIKEGKALSVVFDETKLESDGKRGKLIVLKGQEQKIEADVVIMALGFEHQEKSWLKGVKLADNGAIVVDQNGKTSHSKVYAGGDAVRGASLAVKAAADGKVAALAIIKTLLID